MNYSVVSKYLRCVMAGFLAIMVCFVPVHGDEKEEEYTYSCRTIDMYDYRFPVPYSEYIEDSYYDDAFFAGDSRMGAFLLYGTHENRNVAYATSVSMMTLDITKVDMVEEDVTLYQLLTECDKNNIYILIGINEIRNPNFIVFGEMLQELITKIKNKNPWVNLYLILAYHPDYISNLPEPKLSEHLQDLNTTLINLAIINHTYYLDPDNGLDDEYGTIIDAYVWDGLHLNVDGARAFEEYIDTHVVRSERYVKEVCE